MLRRNEGWGIGIMSIPGAYILLFADKIMVNGPAVESCKNVDDLVRTVQLILEMPLQKSPEEE